MLVITGGKDCAIIIWNAEDGTRMSTLDGHLSLVRCLLPFYLQQESGPALQIASGSMDSTVKVSDLSKSTAIKFSSRQIWNVAGEICSHTLVGHLSFIYCLAVDNASNVLCTGSRDSTIRLWSTLSGWVICEERQHDLVLRNPQAKSCHHYCTFKPHFTAPSPAFFIQGPGIAFLPYLHKL